MLCVHKAACTVPRIEGRGKPGPCCGWKQQKADLGTGDLQDVPQEPSSLFHQGTTQPQTPPETQRCCGPCPKPGTTTKTVVFLFKSTDGNTPLASLLQLSCSRTKPNRCGALDMATAKHQQIRAGQRCPASSPTGPPDPSFSSHTAPIGSGWDFLGAAPRTQTALPKEMPLPPRLLFPSAEQAHSVPSLGPVVNPFVSLSSPLPALNVLEVTIYGEKGRKRQRGAPGSSAPGSSPGHRLRGVGVDGAEDAAPRGAWLLLATPGRASR